MRQVTATEKYRAVNEGKMAKREFVRQMKHSFPQFLSTYDGFDSTIQILKNRGLLFETPAINNIKEAHDHQTAKEGKYSLDALDRGIRAELGAMGLTTFGGPITADQFFKAEAKAKAALDKDPNHYLNLMAGESNKVDKHDKEKEVKRGALDKDTFNDMKKATLKEGVEVQAEELEMSEDAKKNLLGKVVGALRTKYPDITAGILKDFIKTHYQDLLDGADIEDEFAEYISVNYEGPSDMGEKKGTDHDGDGDIDGDDYMAAKDKAIKKAMAKEEQLKEAIKSIIKKTLNEDVINEAATGRLSQKMEEFGGYNGAQGVINSLENIVTEVESFYGKVREKIQKVYDDMGNIENEEGLKIGQFIGPAIESAFMQDLRPVTKKGFTKDLQLPKPKQIDPEMLAQARAAGEVDEAPEDPKATVFTPNF